MIQNDVFLRLNHVSIDFSNLDMAESVTLGHFTCCVGAAVNDVAYGWCDQASN